jgi:superfamily II DNA or RNA helicase
MILRPYQERFINNISAKLRIHRKVVAQLATGGGKTVCFAAICDRYCAKSTQDVLILVHREELLTQACKAINLPVQKVIAGMKSIPHARVYVAMVESAHKRLHLFENIGMVIVDECHIGNFTKVIDHFQEPFIIGFTATPLAAKKTNPLRNYFTDIVCGIDIPDLIEEGFLCPEQTYSARDIVDRKYLKMKGGDFDQGQMANMYKDPKFVITTLKAYKEYAINTKTLIFNCNVEHSKAVNAAFIEQGFNSRHLDADSPDRVEVLEWFANTPNAILNNVGIATTGFDQPDIQTVIVNKATASMPLWLQMCGRGSRPHPTKLSFNIIDLGANCSVHGLWSLPRDWHYIFHHPDKPKTGGVAPVKECPKCGAIHHTAKMVCDSIPLGQLFPCEYKFPKIVVEESGLQEFIEMGNSIDIKKLIKMNEHHKEYRSLFVLIEHVAMIAKQNIKKINEENYIEIEKKNHEIARLWCKQKNRRFNHFHRKLADEKLKTMLNQLYNAHLTLQEHS